MKTTLTTLLLFAILIQGFAQEQVYELRSYEMNVYNSTEVLENYFKDALIPSLERNGISDVGVFEDAGNTWPYKLWVLIPYPDIQSFQDMRYTLLEDKQYLEAAKPYLTAEPGDIPFENYNTTLIQSTAGYSNLVKPEDGSGFYELRIYESYNEDASRRKVKMFNDSEFDIFSDVGVPVVFFGWNLTGAQMPCLTYMMAFKDEEAHRLAWSKFGEHPEWNRIKDLAEYKKAMNGITRVFLRPLAYSRL